MSKHEAMHEAREWVPDLQRLPRPLVGHEACAVVAIGFRSIMRWAPEAKVISCVRTTFGPRLLVSELQAACRVAAMAVLGDETTAPLNLVTSRPEASARHSRARKSQVNSHRTLILWTWILRAPAPPHPTPPVTCEQERPGMFVSDANNRDGRAVVRKLKTSLKICDRRPSVHLAGRARDPPLHPCGGALHRPRGSSGRRSRATGLRGRCLRVTGLARSARTGHGASAAGAYGPRG